MILLWLLCVGLVLGGLLASLAHQIPWGRLRFPRPQRVPAVSPVWRLSSRRRARGPRGRALAPPERGLPEGPPGRWAGVG